MKQIEALKEDNTDKDIKPYSCEIAKIEMLQNKYIKQNNSPCLSTSSA